MAQSGHTSSLEYEKREGKRTRGRRGEKGKREGERTREREREGMEGGRGLRKG